MYENSYPVKVLSTGYEMLYTTSWQDAISDVVGGRTEIIEAHPKKTIGLVDGAMAMPISVRFKVGVFLSAIQHRIKSDIGPNRKRIFARDDGECQYCNQNLKFEESTLDHVLPKSQGGRDTWKNLVLCCETCNRKKGSMIPTQVGLRLKKRPTNPFR